MHPITYTCHPASPEEINTTVTALRAHTEECTGAKVTHEAFALTAYDSNKLIGSIIGKIYSRWLHLELVWVDEAHRGQGIGRKLITLSMEEAEKRGLAGIEVWTQSWQAPEFYLRTGFEEYAVLDDFLPGHKRHVFRYTLEHPTS